MNVTNAGDQAWRMTFQSFWKSCGTSLAELFHSSETLCQPGFWRAALATASWRKRLRLICLKLSDEFYQKQGRNVLLNLD